MQPFADENDQEIEKIMKNVTVKFDVSNEDLGHPEELMDIKEVVRSASRISGPIEELAPHRSVYYSQVEGAFKKPKAFSCCQKLG